ncbi:hypothetical protein EJ04DRAFT_579838 [Polyplosphaeria fusca]|uniref:Uncharacterized protein n=1 Tax=Polyplosphaeria fusca TaxID=682080 RepID=A0A9P4QT42_9PLEO|nr:hypothetical protein EJ04DRAFT_579838 [Polyplosphaeria fusca]
MYRTVLSRQARLFTSSAIARKGPVDAGKDALKAVDRTVSDAAVKGIEKGEQAASTVKQSLPNSAAEAKGEAKGKAAEVAGEAKGKAAELKGEAKSKV